MGSGDRSVHGPSREKLRLLTAPAVYRLQSMKQRYGDKFTLLDSSYYHQHSSMHKCYSYLTHAVDMTMYIVVQYLYKVNTSK